MIYLRWIVTGQCGWIEEGTPPRQPKKSMQQYHDTDPKTGVPDIRYSIWPLLSYFFICCFLLMHGVEPSAFVYKRTGAGEMAFKASFLVNTVRSEDLVNRY